MTTSSKEVFMFDAPGIDGCGRGSILHVPATDEGRYNRLVIGTAGEGMSFPSDVMPKPLTSQATGLLARLLCRI